MKTIIALLLGATGAAAFTTGVKAATVGLGSFATASYPALSEEIVAPAAMTAFPVKDAPGRRLADRCEDWCSDPSSGGGQPWNVRCGWDDKACSGCDECNSCSATGCCFDWCADHSEPWNVRCGWDDKACSGCAQCNSCSDIGCCFGWCAGESAPWNERCGWDTDDCSACAECCAAPKYVKDDLCRACPSGHTCDGTVMTKCDAPKYVLNNVCTACPIGYKCATNTYVLNNECTACPSGHTCDGTKATKCVVTKYVKANACTDCPSGHTCDGTSATACAANTFVADNVCKSADQCMDAKYLKDNKCPCESWCDYDFYDWLYDYYYYYNYYYYSDDPWYFENWEERCNWSACSGCDECQHKVCKDSLCHGSKDPWKVKCAWDISDRKSPSAPKQGRACSGCSACINLGIESSSSNSGGQVVSSSSLAIIIPVVVAAVLLVAAVLYLVRKRRVAARQPHRASSMPMPAGEEVQAEA